MMATLLKHEWLRTRGLLGVVTGLGGLVVVLAAALTAVDLSVLSLVTLVVGVVAALALVPALQIALGVDFWTSSYRRTGYFTQSLPLRGSTIFLAKLAWNALATVGGIVATLILAGVLWTAAALRAGTYANPVAAVQDLWATITGVASPGMLAAGAAALLMMYLVWPVLYLFAASVGSETPLNRLGLGGPVVVLVVLYLVVQMLMVAGMFAVPYAVGMDGGRLGFVPFDLLSQMTTTETAADGVTVTVGPGSSQDMPVGYLAPVLLIIALSIWRSIRSWDRKISLV